MQFKARNTAPAIQEKHIIAELCNARLINNKIAIIRDLIKSHDITETWLDGNAGPIYEATIPRNYLVLHLERQGQIKSG